MVMLGGLHSEMALWSIMGDLLLGAIWPEALNEAGLVKTQAAATVLLKASIVIRRVTKLLPQVRSVGIRHGGQYQ